MKAFNSYLEGKLIDLKNSKFGREEGEKIGLYSSISNRQKREEEFNILTKLKKSHAAFCPWVKKNNIKGLTNQNNFAIYNNVRLGSRPKSDHRPLTCLTSSWSSVSV